ncbi:MAG TPA: metal-sensing transcriptional repressor [Ktedonobacteraceae bacterium]|nr:metal-sensing transcriptional repressor [Ktedonobacteraceae bacterium]
MAGEQAQAREDIALRLARIAGHAASLKRLWDEGREGRDMLTQIVAVRAALDAVGRAILEQEIDRQLSRALATRDSSEASRALKEALDRLL